MPMINVFASKNALTRVQVELLTEKLTHELLVIEGVDSDRIEVDRLGHVS
jgi:hypothetical protein